ncbi:MAG: prepilin-type N-terminal cleavage/methylation domain-containing protein [Woeseiaceae bacterium]
MKSIPIINKQQGFTLLELIVVIIVISILGLFAIDRIFAIRIAAEQAAVKQLVGTIKSALGLEVARLALDGKMYAVAKLDKSNPLLLLSQNPNNYIGEKNNGKKITEPGVWYFDKKQKTLVYNVLYAENFKTTLKGLPRIRHRIKLVYNDRNKNRRFDLRIDGIAGLDLISLDKFSWTTKTKDISKKNI